MSSEENYASITIVTNADGESAVATELNGNLSEEAFIKLFTALVNGDYNTTIVRSLFEAYNNQNKLVPKTLIDAMTKVIRENAIKKIVDVDEIPVIRPLNALTNMSIREDGNGKEA